MTGVSRTSQTADVAASASRRLTLAGLGALALASLGHPDAAEARRKSVSKKARQKCQRQVAPCLASFTPMCVDDPTCLAELERCCPLTGSCDVIGFFDCLSAPSA